MSAVRYKFTASVDFSPLAAIVAIHRAAERRIADIAFADDARRYPAFALARRAAVMAVIEHQRPTITAGWTGRVLSFLREYEDRRGGMRAPDAEAVAFGEHYLEDEAVATYERVRRMS